MCVGCCVLVYPHYRKCKYTFTILVLYFVTVQYQVLGVSDHHIEQCPNLPFYKVQTIL